MRLKNHSISSNQSIKKLEFLNRLPESSGTYREKIMVTMRPVDFVHIG